MATRQTYKVKIKLGDAEVDVEGAETGVVKIVAALSDVLRGARRVSAVPISAAGNVATPTPAPRSSAVDIRRFFEEKQPSSDLEAAAAAAYYYQFLAPEGSRKEAIDSATLQEAFRLARWPLPARTIYTLQNARGAGYLDSVKEGQFRLNPVGYNLVEHTLGSSEPREKRRKKSKKASRKSG